MMSDEALVGELDDEDLPEIIKLRSGAVFEIKGE